MSAKSLVVILIFLLTHNTQADGKYVVTKSSCAALAKDIKYLSSKLRMGYSISQGEQWKKKYRHFQKLRYECYKKRFPVELNR